MLFKALLSVVSMGGICDDKTNEDKQNTLNGQTSEKEPNTQSKTNTNHYAQGKFQLDKQTEDSKIILLSKPIEPARKEERSCDDCEQVTDCCCCVTGCLC